MKVVNDTKDISVLIIEYRNFQTNNIKNIFTISSNFIYPIQSLQNVKLSYY